MSFPTTSILDNFNRADGTLTDDPDWVSGVTTDFLVASNQCNDPNGFCDDFWNHSYTDTEVYITLNSDCFQNDNRVAVGCRYAISPLNGYFLYWRYNSGSQTLGFWKHVNGVDSQIGTDISVSLVAGNKIGLSVIGTTLTAYTYTSGAWSSVGTQTDSSHSSGLLWLFALMSNGTGVNLDDFGGGTVVAAATIFKRRSEGQRTGSRSGG